MSTRQPLRPSLPIAPAAGDLVSPIAALLGKPPSAWTVDDLAGLCESRGIRLVALMHPGGDGQLKTLDFAPSGAGHLRDVLSGGERADGSSLFRGLGIGAGASDILLRPRLDTAFLDPFAPVETLALLCGHAGADLRPLGVSPDTIVRRAHARLLGECGLDLWALGEVEFFLGRPVEDGDHRGGAERGYHATQPFVAGEALRRQALALLAGMGVAVKYGHSEVGYVGAEEGKGMVWEQHEIELGLQPLPRAADAVLLTRWVLANLARAHGDRLSFEPVLKAGHAGNGCHFHFSPMAGGVARGGIGPDGQPSAEAQWLIAGLVEAGGALMAFGNRVEGSFLRLAQGKETPRAIVWGARDRTALVRLPAVPSAPDGRPVSPPTVEFRLPDGSAHPHLVLAGAAQALAFGRRHPDLPGLLARSAASQGQGAAVPRSRGEVARALERSRAVLEDGGVFPPALVDQVLAGLGSAAPAAGRPAGRKTAPARRKRRAG